mmetsp:Transcript_54531/g.130066  ORF Transcript_54531/g.130066 Transcript_54531/m.130066 type:complete len:766 (+) Transcript_54531:162-2459(+)
MVMVQADCQQAQALKRIFKQWDRDGSGCIERACLASVLQALSIRNGAADFKPEGLLDAIPDAKGMQVSYNDFVDFLFSSAAAEPQDRPGTSAPENELERFVLVRASSSEDEGWALKNLGRVATTLREGGLPHASTPKAALKAFFASSDAESLSHATKENMATVLDFAESTGFFVFTGSRRASGDSSPKVTVRHACGTASPESLAALQALLQPQAPEWDRFARFGAEWLLLKAFKFFDTRGHKRLSAQELMNFLMLLSVQKEEGFSLQPSDAEHIVQEFDVCGDGGLTEAEFLDMVHHLRDEGTAHGEALSQGQLTNITSGDKKAHLVLNFDVNNTIMVADSLTAAGASELISMTIAGCAWGMKTRHRCGREVWVLVSPKPTHLPPWEGLVSYTEFIVEQCPMPTADDVDEVKKVKAWRRRQLQTFCEKGQPGEAFKGYRDRLFGMLSHSQRLLPTFYHLLKKLKEVGRSFSIVLRTFGVDISGAVQEEFNAFCEGRHPEFPGEPLLDGSDGGGDYRMRLDDPESIGTFFRDPSNGDMIALVWGTHQQPERQEEGLEWFNNIPNTKVVVGAKAAAESLEARLNSGRGMVVIRDYYPAWASCKCKGIGGKPVFLHVEDDAVMPVFFDDHIRPADPNIVDAIDVRTYPARIPMPQVYQTHLVKALPLSAIASESYFWDELQECERLKAEQMNRRRKVARMLHDVGAIRSVIRLLSGTEDIRELLEPPVAGQMSRQPSDALGEGAEAMKYTPWQKTEVVKHAAPFVGIS